MRLRTAAALARTALALVMAFAFATARPISASAAEDYPARPVRIIVPYGAGGIADVTMRLVAQKLGEELKQQFFIDNRPGAGGVVGLKAAASAAPDGYTLAMIGGGLTIAKSLFRSLPYDLVRDFAPISTTASYGLFVAAKAGSRLRSVAEVIAAAREKPGRLNFGTINPGSAQNLSAELFRTMAKISVAMIPYKTTPDLATALMRGDVDVAFEYYAGFEPQIVEHQIVPLAFTGAARTAHRPDVPTVAESGLPGYDVTSWNGLAAPAGVAPPIVALLNRAVNQALRAPDVQATSRQFGLDAHGSTPEELRERIARDIDKWAQVIAQAGIPQR